MFTTGFDRAGLSARLVALAQRGVYLGTSSWKYPGWLGQIYDEERYLHHGRFSLTRFGRRCLAEYAETFSTVCVDAAYYRFPDERHLESLVSQVPPGFRFGFKVTDEITVRRFSNLPRFGDRAGQVNPGFLNAERFVTEFLEPCAAFRDSIGVLIFEFSRFYPSDFARGRDFVAALDGFLGALPGGWPYAVEIRNHSFLHPDYFAVLARHGVSHTFNNWDVMPDIAEQLDLPGSMTAPHLATARFLLRSGRRYQEAVERFAPYARIQDANPAGRAAGARIIRDTLAATGGRRAFLYVNNRFEGNAPQTIAAMLEQVTEPQGP
ncbi:MAG: DUF72 domain-containing protein [Verrucomicrobiales bacterium]|nr:DUF72 domain-containing protein [Verrucomicrobiales bacterium]MCP5526431.1 DUF72 domain-containing protein [Verrucomicrobiales bacterium]